MSAPYLNLKAADCWPSAAELLRDEVEDARGELIATLEDAQHAAFLNNDLNDLRTLRQEIVNVVSKYTVSGRMFRS